MSVWDSYFYCSVRPVNRTLREQRRRLTAPETPQGQQIALKSAFRRKLTTPPRGFTPYRKTAPLAGMSV
jgi:hypothetical protein